MEASEPPLTPYGAENGASRAIDQIDSVGGTDLSAGVRAGLSLLESSGSRKRILILLTDGQGPYDGALTARAKAIGVHIFPVGLGIATNFPLLNDLAYATDGDYFDAATPEKLRVRFLAISRRAAEGSSCPPTVPTDVVATPKGRRSADVRWTEPRYSDQPITAYEVEVVSDRSIGNTDRITTRGAPLATNVRFTDLASQAVRFHVRAVSESGESMWSVPSSITEIQLREDAERIYGLPLSDFITAKNKEVPGRLDFSDDGCSGVPVTSGTVQTEFLYACQRHDFGYRNFGAGGLDKTMERKQDIDARLYSDMVDTCKTFPGPVTVVELIQIPCEGAALLFYEGVTRLGDAFFFGKKECGEVTDVRGGRGFVGDIPIYPHEAAEIIECNRAYYDGTGLEGERRYDTLERRLVVFP